MKRIHLIQTIAFLSALLLFQIELIIAKLFLPNFGGSYMVWGACVVFFQAALMLGYRYSQAVVEKFGIERYRIMHAALALLPLLSFPGRALPMTFDALPWPLVLSVFWHLCILIGPVFFVLSTTSVIWQMWLVASDLPERNNPYVLFAVSNAGSLVALLTYPFLVELYLDLPAQQNIWRAGYLVFVLLQWWAFKIIPVKEAKPRKVELKPVKPARLIHWLCYSAAGVMMFLAVTNIVTAEIAPLPLLWVAPLVIYLVSFILNFKKKPYCPRWLREDIHSVAGFAVVIYFVVQVPLLPVLLDMFLLFMMTYLVCMHTQYRLYQSRPGDHRYLPFYYFIVSVGSLLGGVFVSWIMPLLSTAYAEYFAAFLVIAAALLTERRRRRILPGILMAFAAIILMMMWPLIFSQPEVRLTWIQFAGLAGLLVLVPLVFSNLRDHPAAFAGCLAVFTVLTPLIETRWSLTEHIYRYRNYYGAGKVRLADGARTLVHGTTIHGSQYVQPALEHIPLAYYGYRSPVGELLQQDVIRLERMGIIGLGIGTMATYFRPDQTVDIFELDPDIYQLARTHFRFLARAKGTVRYHTGDGRLLLGEIPDGTYDLLIIDAFSGDAVPVHLLTREALELYRRKVKPDGVVLFHISNRYFFLGAPLTATARSLEAEAAIKEGPKTQELDQSSLWLAVTWDPARLATLVREWNWSHVSPASPRIRVWTDRYHTVLPYIEYSNLWRDSMFLLKRLNAPVR
ncbi:MAG: fused MFS/spermidine synthase [Candidatus Omnitrophica bacterium]|nr:fused MFS/spermidine synthase [Candidatus Omnitrophota bacterium]MCB9720033.1 fused MFS/spermidine synthase [Candidatus Omnitrophota bacterium]